MRNTIRRLRREQRLSVLLWTLLLLGWLLLSGWLAQASTATIGILYP